MDGYETTKAIRQMEAPNNAIPIVALTANATKIDAKKCLDAGMNDFLPKPFTPDDLYRKLFIDLKIVPTKENVKKTNREKLNVSKQYNLDYLRTVSGNNHEFMQEMIQTFVSSIPPILDDLSANAMVANWEKVGNLAHQIKPSFILMGSVVLKEKILEIENRSKQGINLPTLKETIDQFRKNCLEVINSLSSELMP